MPWYHRVAVHQSLIPPPPDTTTTTTTTTTTPTQTFYSYYNAFQLNKILFQTQTVHNKRFIHRLLVLNPLTNSDIIGNVQYFKVTRRVEGGGGAEGAAAGGGAGAGAGYKLEALESSVKPPARPKQTARAGKKGDKQGKSTQPEMSGAGGALANTGGATTKGKQRQQQGSKLQVSIKQQQALAGEPQDPVSPTVRESETRKQDWTWSSPKSAALPLDEVVETHLSPGTITTTSSKQGQLSPVPTPSPNSTFPTTTDVRVETYMNVTVRTKKSPKTAARYSLQVPVSPGTVTQFNIPVHDNEEAKQVLAAAPAMQETGNSRLYSYRNTTILSPKKPSLEEWVVKMAEGKESQRYDGLLISPVQGEPPALGRGAAATTTTTTGTSPAYYEAILFATDTDYLESARVRKLFRSQALMEEDAILFNMPEVKRSPDVTGGGGGAVLVYVGANGQGVQQGAPDRPLASKGFQLLLDAVCCTSKRENQVMVMTVLLVLIIAGIIFAAPELAKPK